LFLCHIEFVYVLAVDVALATKRRQLNRTVVISNRKGLSVNEQITGPDRQVVPPELTPFLTNYHSMKMSIDIDQFSYVEKLARMTRLYLELRLQQVREKAQEGNRR
jgi:hypothetical protein